MNQTQHLSQRKFTSLFGVSRETYQILWRVLHDCNGQWPNSFQPKNLEWCLYFLKNYPTIHSMSVLWKADTKTLQKWIWKMIFCLIAKLNTISLENRPYVDWDISIIVDGTECPIQRPHQHDYVYFYSGKNKQYSIKYEVGIYPLNGLIVWMAGGVGGSVHDLTMLRESSLLTLLRHNEFILAVLAILANRK